MPPDSSTALLSRRTWSARRLADGEAARGAAAVGGRRGPAPRPVGGPRSRGGAGPPGDDGGGAAAVDRGPLAGAEGRGRRGGGRGTPRRLRTDSDGRVSS